MDIFTQSLDACSTIQVSVPCYHWERCFESIESPEEFPIKDFAVH